MNREEKTTAVQALEETFANNNFFVLLDYRGMKAESIYNFRREIKACGANVKVSKNTLTRIAIADTNANVVKDYLLGPIAIAYSTEPVSLSKIVVKFLKEDQALEVKGACLDGKELNEFEIKDLSKLGSLAEVRSMLLGVLSGTQSKLVGLLNAPARDLVSVCRNYSETK